jgi:hypothetical protein
MYADQAGLGAAVRLIEISRDTDRRMSQLCEIDTRHFGAGLRRK